MLRFTFSSGGSCGTCIRGGSTATESTGGRDNDDSEQGDDNYYNYSNDDLHFQVLPPVLPGYASCGTTECICLK